MITKKEIKELMQKYLWPDDKIIDIDLPEVKGSCTWVLVKSSSGLIYFYSIHDYGKVNQKVYKGVVMLSDVKTNLLKY